MPPLERLALIVKRQLQQVGIEMTIEEVPVDQQIAAIKSGHFEASLTTMISGPTLLRTYQIWHSGGFWNYKQRGASTPRSTRFATRPSTTTIQAASRHLQQAMVDDPPAIFLAWSEQARAVSKRFAVPVEEGRDILFSVRLWKLASGAAQREPQLT